jgi:hypothetical protein
MVGNTWKSSIDEVRLIHKEVRAVDMKIKRLLQARSTEEVTLWQCRQAKAFVEKARTAIAQIPKIKDNEKQVFELLLVAASNLHTAIVRTSPVEGTINETLCAIYVRVFNLMPIGCCLQEEVV